MSKMQWSGRALCVAALAGSLAGCDFIQPVVENPNAVPVATLDQILVGVTVNHYYEEESQSARIAAMFLQQMNGTDRQFETMSEYVLTEEDAADLMDDLYVGGALVDIRNGIRKAETDGRRVYAGIFKVYEAFEMGMAASEYGDLPYSEAVNPEIENPALDTQRSVYDAVLLLLDEAIADLQSGEGAGPGGADFAYGGNVDRWVAAAHTLKARLNLHWVEVDGNARYTAARDEALQGILSADGDWLADHSTAAPETFMWRQFMRDRAAYIVGGKFLADLMNTNNDPRILYYFSYGAAGSVWADTVIGSAPGEDAPGDVWNQASELACGPNNALGCQGYGYGSAEFDFPILTCAENNFILAEAHYQLADETAARDALDAALQCAEDLWTGQYGVPTIDLQPLRDRNDAMNSAALFQEIMEQKYTQQFLNRDIWNDYKRVCTPAITPFDYPNQVVPGRLLYSNNERQSNTNVPEPAQQPLRNANDPNPCP